MRHVAKVAAERWFSADERAWLARIYGEFPNLRAAVAWCGATGHSEVGLDIITDVMAVRMPFFYALETQMCGWLEDLLALGPAEPTPARIQSVAMLGWTRIVLGDQDLGKVHRDECQSLARQLNAEKAPPVLFLEGSYQVFSLADRAGLDLLVAARDGFRAAGAHGNAHMAALLLAMGAGLLGPSHLADQYSDECLADALAHKAKWAISWAQWTQGLPARTHPQDVLRNVLPVQIALGDRWGSTWTVESETWRRAAAGQFDSAALLLGGSISLQRRHGVRIGGLIPFARQRAKAIHRIIAEIGEDAYRTAYDKGSALTTDEVYELALRRPSDAEPAHRVPAASEHALSPRQRHVAQLIGKGYSNKKIAAEMNLSTRTVETHLRAIYSQLQLNRTQLAARAREQHQTSPD
jgi:non-specific serine/threonine protein kinase